MFQIQYIHSLLFQLRELTDHLHIGGQHLHVGYLRLFAGTLNLKLQNRSFRYAVLMDFLKSK